METLKGFIYGVGLCVLYYTIQSILLRLNQLEAVMNQIMTAMTR